MLLFVRHETELTYDQPVSETTMELRMTPRSDEHQTLRTVTIDVGPEASLSEHIDWLGNRVQQFSVLPYHDRLRIVAQSAVDVHSKHPGFDALADAVGAGREDPSLRDFLRFSGPIARDPRMAALAARLGADDGEPVRAVERITTGLCDEIAYRKGVTTSSTALREVLDAGAGVCQDLAHLAIALLRARGIPARYVSGYLLRRGGEAELETHAWCEAYLPAVGWLAVDPTHRKVADDDHVAVAVGRDFSDVPPNRGVYRGSAAESIRARVHIEEVDRVPEGLLTQWRTPIEVPTYGDAPRVHSEQLDYEQEQQQQQQ